MGYSLPASSSWQDRQRAIWGIVTTERILQNHVTMTTKSRDLRQETRWKPRHVPAIVDKVKTIAHVYHDNTLNRKPAEIYTNIKQFNCAFVCRRGKYWPIKVKRQKYHKMPYISPYSWTQTFFEIRVLIETAHAFSVGLRVFAEWRISNCIVVSWALRETERAQQNLETFEGEMKFKRIELRYLELTSLQLHQYR